MQFKYIKITQNDINVNKNITKLSVSKKHNPSIFDIEQANY